jgi:chaperonin cofactor prefoldin
MEQEDRDKLNRIFHELEKRIETLEEKVALLERRRA